MIKKIFIFVFAFLILFNGVQAWSYDERYIYGSATAYAEVEGSYPKCDGEKSGSLCKGKYYVDFGFTGDKFYMKEKASSWPTATANGYNEIPSIANGRYYFDEGEVPYYIICAWDKDTASNGEWAWTSICGGYLGNQFFSGLKTVECLPNENGCEGVNYFICEDNFYNSKGAIIGECGVECIGAGEKCEDSILSICKYNKFISQGKVVDKCGIECIMDSDCQVEAIGELECFKNDIYINAKVDKCTEENTCAEEKVFVENCIIGCNNDKCILQPNKAVPIIIISGISLLIVLIMFIGLKRRKGSKHKK